MKEELYIQATAEDVRNADTRLDKSDSNQNFIDAIMQLIVTSSLLGMNYILIDKNVLNPDIVDVFKNAGYNVIIGYGDVARAKITW